MSYTTVEFFKNPATLRYPFAQIEYPDKDVRIWTIVDTLLECVKTSVDDRKLSTKYERLSNLLPTYRGGTYYKMMCFSWWNSREKMGYHIMFYIDDMLSSDTWNIQSSVFVDANGNKSHFVPSNEFLTEHVVSPLVDTSRMPSLF